MCGSDLHLYQDARIGDTPIEAPFVIVSHGTEADPVLNYGNRAALDLWEMTWEQLTSTPSRLTAEPMNREERARMLAVAATQGYFTGYRGVRISATGKRFLVEDATVWNVVDASGILAAVAAMFASRYHPAMMGEEPAAVRIKVPVRFVLTD